MGLLDMMNSDQGLLGLHLMAAAAPRERRVGFGEGLLSGLQGVQAKTMEELTAALNKAIDDQMNHGKTTLIEALINQELGEPFRRDAMKKPVEVAGISKADMRPQAV